MLKIGFTSDFHLGFKFDEKTEDDSFLLAYQVLQKLKDCDVICVLGDIFDTKNPSPKVIAKTIRIFRSLKKDSKEEIVYYREEQEKRTKKPLIIALHGNHERKIHKENTPVKILEEAGLVEYLHLEKIEIRKNGEKVNFYGMSFVPEIFAKKILLEKWMPNKNLDESSFNILLLHQNIFPFVYTKEEPSLSISNLPKEFDLIVNGHIHIPVIQKIDESTTLLITGSTLITKMMESEIEKPKKFFVVEIKNRNFEINQFEIVQLRKYILKTFSSDENAIEKISNFLKDLLLYQTNGKEPIIKIKIEGKKKIDERRLKALYNVYKERAIIFFENKTEKEIVLEKLEELRELKNERISIDSIIIKVLLERLKKNGFKNSFDFSVIFNLLKEGEIEKAYSILVEGQQIIKEFWKK